MKRKNSLFGRRLAALLLCLMLAAALLPLGAGAQGSDRVVRVGWYESPFNTTDALGRRSGYAYEYQQKIAAYSGWTYEYVKGSWPDLMQMLIDGKIDLMSDVSYTEERTESMLFSSLPMGSEEYYLYAAPRNEAISAEDLSTLNGKKVGINKGSVQIGYFREWAEANGVEAEIVEMTGLQEANVDALNRGEIDLYVMLDFYLDTSRAVPLFKVGSSDFFFAVSKARPELMPELNAAMNSIVKENRYYNQQLTNKYLKSSGVNRFLNGEEKAWLAAHGPVRVGYQDNYLAFCASDPKTGELTGALKDYLSMASDLMENAHIDFEAYAYPTAEDALEAMKNGEVDCVFPANLTEYDGETRGFFLSPPLMSTDMSAVVRAEDQKTFTRQRRVSVAVNAGNPNYDIFLQNHFPDWHIVYFKDTPECLKAIADGQADCLLISNFRYNNIAMLCEQYDLVTLSTGVEMDYCFAVKRDDTALYSILAKITGVMPASAVNASLSYYFTEDAKNTISDIINQNIGVVVTGLAAVALLILFLMLRSARTEKKYRAELRLVSATETDELTGLYSKNYFYEYAERMFRERPEKPMDAIVLNIEQFHAVNALKGQLFGDQTLQVLGNAIRTFLKEYGGIAGREEADNFVLYIPHMEDPRVLLDRLHGVLDTLSPDASIRLRMGVMPWQPDMPPQQMIEQARVACGLARGNTRERVVVFDDTLREREAFEQRLLNDLRRAVDNGEFVVYYQPKYDIQADPPVLKSAEALVRWRHPELGMLMPEKFIYLLERSGQIGLVDKLVWSEAARQVARWKKEYGVAVPVSVNLSRLDLFDLTLESTLDAVLEENGLSHSDLKLEVTESACTENAHQVIDVIDRLRRKGYEIEMDDFGSGYSSLNMLSSMPIDVLKMDRAFVSNIEHEEKDRQLVELILGIARSLKVPVIIEGVENEAQLRMLRELGCSLVQGNYFSRPLPANEFEQTLLNPSGA